MNSRQQISDLSRAEILTWLDDALHGRLTLPKLTVDEPVFVTILEIEPELDDVTRQNLRWACGELVRNFASQGNSDDEYVRGLLFVAARLDCQPSSKDPKGLLLANWRAPLMPEVDFPNTEPPLSEDERTRFLQVFGRRNAPEESEKERDHRLFLEEMYRQRALQRILEDQ